MDCVAAVSSGTEEKPPEGGLTPKERKIMERMLLELYCQYDPSLHFRDVVSPEVIGISKLCHDCIVHHWHLESATKRDSTQCPVNLNES